jgi:hypothetical protein
MWAITGSTLNAVQRNVAIALARHASELDVIVIGDVSYAIVFPGLERLCWAANTSLNTVRKALRDLDAVGFARAYAADDELRQGRSFKKCYLLNSAALTALPAWRPGILFNQPDAPRRGARRGQNVTPSTTSFPQPEGVKTERGRGQFTTPEGVKTERGRGQFLPLEEDLDRNRDLEVRTSEEDQPALRAGVHGNGTKDQTARHAPARPNVLHDIDIAALRAEASRPLKPRLRDSQPRRRHA